jgi:hypothetical protein
VDPVEMAVGTSWTERREERGGERVHREAKRLGLIGFFWSSTREPLELETIAWATYVPNAGAFGPLLVTASQAGYDSSSFPHLRVPN